MSLKDQLTAAKQASRNYETISKQVEDILMKAAKEGEPSVTIPLTDEGDYKTQVVCNFLNEEGIKFEKVYNTYQIERFAYVDTHMGGYRETSAHQSPTYMETKHRFKGIRVFL